MIYATISYVRADYTVDAVLSVDGVAHLSRISIPVESVECEDIPMLQRFIASKIGCPGMSDPPYLIAEAMRALARTQTTTSIALILP